MTCRWDRSKVVEALVRQLTGTDNVLPGLLVMEPRPLAYRLISLGFEWVPNSPGSKIWLLVQQKPNPDSILFFASKLLNAQVGTKIFVSWAVNGSSEPLWTDATGTVNAEEPIPRFLPPDLFILPGMSIYLFAQAGLLNGVSTAGIVLERPDSPEWM